MSYPELFLLMTPFLVFSVSGLGFCGWVIHRELRTIRKRKQFQ